MLVLKSITSKPCLSGSLTFTSEERTWIPHHKEILLLFFVLIQVNWFTKYPWKNMRWINLQNLLLKIEFSGRVLCTTTLI